MTIDFDLYNPDFAIIDESADWIVVDKPAHLLVHPSKPGNPPTLLDGLEQLLMYELATGGSLSIINRLDRETSGIVLIAKHKQAATELAKAREQKEFTKIYQVIVRGWPQDDEFVIDAPIIRKGEVASSDIYIRQMVHPDGSPSESRFGVVERLEKNGFRYSILRCHLVTGRTHQIRVHLEHAGVPVLGDKIYGHTGQPYLDFIKRGWTQQLERQLLINRHALHAGELKWRDFSWKSPLSKDLQEFLKK